MMALAVGPRPASSDRSSSISMAATMATAITVAASRARASTLEAITAWDSWMIRLPRDWGGALAVPSGSVMVVRWPALARCARVRRAPRASAWRRIGQLDAGDGGEGFDQPIERASTPRSLPVSTP